MTFQHTKVLGTGSGDSVLQLEEEQAGISMVNWGHLRDGLTSGQQTAVSFNLVWCECGLRILIIRLPIGRYFLTSVLAK